MRDRRRNANRAPQGAGILIWMAIGLAFWVVVIYQVI